MFFGESALDELVEVWVQTVVSALSEDSLSRDSCLVNSETLYSRLRCEHLRKTGPILRHCRKPLSTILMSCVFECAG